VRVTGGKLRGRTLAAPRGRDTRPTSDRARESLFSILQHGLGLDFEGLAVVDVFAGSGALGLEALSRGAASALFLDNNRAALDCIKDNVQDLGLEGIVEVKRLDGGRLGPPPAGLKPAGLAFLDPPYGRGLIEPALRGLAEKEWLAAGAHCVCEMGRGDDFSPPAGFEQVDQREQGETRLVFLCFMAKL